MPEATILRAGAWHLPPNSCEPDWQACAGLGKLDLSNSPVGDSEVLDAIHQLRSLQVLRLSGCKKLTTALVCSPSHAAKLCQLSSLCLQRCYQLEASTLTCLLAATAEADARLTLLIMSHLVLSQWPGGPAQLGADGMPIPPQPTVAVPASRLQILGLNNCMRVGAAALSTIASTCSQLQVLLLGGCTLSNGDVQSLHNPADCKICREQLASLRARASATTVTSKASQLAGLALHLEDLAVLELTHTVTPMEMVALRDVLRLGNCRTHCISLCSSLDTQVQPTPQLAPLNIPLKAIQLPLFDRDGIRSISELLVDVRLVKGQPWAMAASDNLQHIVCNLGMAMMTLTIHCFEHTDCT